MPNDNDIELITKANRAAWNASADLHESGEQWQRLKEGFRDPGFSTFDPTMSGLLQQVKVEGKSVVQIGCNNGRELLSLMSLGATSALGIDQSDDFIAQAQELKDIAQRECTFLRANIFDLPPDTQQGFDLCVITIGVLNWMPDLPLFFGIAGSLLKQGGTLVVYETHPYLEMFDPSSENPYLPAQPYFNDQPIVSNEAITYDGEKSEASTPSYWFSHTLSDILNACLAAKMRLLEFNEYSHSNREVDYDIYTSNPNKMPLCYSLIANKVVV